VVRERRRPEAVKKLITPLVTVLFSLALLVGLQATASADTLPSTVVISSHQGRGETVFDFGFLCNVTQPNQVCITTNISIEPDVLGEQDVRSQVMVYDYTQKKWLYDTLYEVRLAATSQYRLPNLHVDTHNPWTFAPGTYYIRTVYQWYRNGWQRYEANTGLVTVN
jgi:hypothetical protein